VIGLKRLYGALVNRTNYENVHGGQNPFAGSWLCLFLALCSKRNPIIYYVSLL